MSKFLVFFVVFQGWVGQNQFCLLSRLYCQQDSYRSPALLLLRNTIPMISLHRPLSIISMGCNHPHTRHQQDPAEPWAETLEQRSGRSMLGVGPKAGHKCNHDNVIIMVSWCHSVRVMIIKRSLPDQYQLMTNRGRQRKKNMKFFQKPKICLIKMFSKKVT